MENSTLKDEILDLRRQLTAVTDHAIASDTRLLQYTDQVFVANTSSLSTPQLSTASTQSDTPRLMSASPSVVTSIPSSPDRNIDAESASQVLPSSPVTRTTMSSQAQNITVGRKDQPLTDAPAECHEHMEQILSLRTTIEVLEAEVLSLRNSYARCLCSRVATEDHGWNKVTRKRSPLGAKNAMKNCSPPKNNLILQLTNEGHHTVEGGNKRTFVSRKKTTNKIIRTKARLDFNNLQVEADSHGRLLAGLLTGSVETNTRVTGMCKPSARLAAVVPSCPPPPCTCRVIIAGSNDVASGQHDNIYRNLESLLTNIPSSSGVLLATLPFRHDLHPRHPVNEEILFVNSFILDLCSRYVEVEPVEVNTIRRGAFTGQGMHLRLRGKRQLANLIVEGALKLQKRLKQLQKTSATCPLPGATDHQTTGNAAVAHHHNTYSEAVRIGSVPKVSSAELPGREFSGCVRPPIGPREDVISPQKPSSDQSSTFLELRDRSVEGLDLESTSHARILSPTGPAGV